MSTCPPQVPPEIIWPVRPRLRAERSRRSAMRDLLLGALPGGIVLSRPLARLCGYSRCRKPDRYLNPMRAHASGSLSKLLSKPRTETALTFGKNWNTIIRMTFRCSYRVWEVDGDFVLESILEKDPDNSLWRITITFTRSKRATIRRGALASAERPVVPAPAAGHMVHMPGHIFQRRCAKAKSLPRPAGEDRLSVICRSRKPGRATINCVQLRCRQSDGEAGAGASTPSWFTPFTRKRDPSPLPLLWICFRV